MNGMSINLSGNALQALDKMEATLADRRDVMENLGVAVEGLCKRYVQADIGHRHASAEKLGAAPTGFLGGAIESIHTTSDAAGATVDFQHPWFARVGHDVDIRPGEGATHLTIPVAAEAYGKRIFVGDRQPRFPGGFFFVSKKGNLMYGVREGKGIKPLYFLPEHVHQEQDRSRLPDDQAILDTATGELRNQLDQRLAALNNVTA
jgi:hypothetical protein